MGSEHVVCTSGAPLPWPEGTSEPGIAAALETTKDEQAGGYTTASIDPVEDNALTSGAAVTAAARRG